MRKGVFKAAYDGASEVWGAVLASTLTTLAVFIPIVFIQEEAGQMFRDIAITISTSIALSLLVSITVIPTLTTLLIHLKPGEEYRPGFFHRTLFKPIVLMGKKMSDAYSGLMEWMLRNSPPSILFRVLVIACVGWMLWYSVKTLPEKDYLPYGNVDMVFMLIEPVAGTPVETNMRYMAEYEKKIVAMEDVNRNFLVFSSRFNGGGAIIEKELAAGQRGEVKMAVKSREMGREIFEIPGYRFAFAMQRPIFRSANKTFEVEITGPDMLKLKSNALDLIGKISGIKGVHSVRPEFKFGNPELRFIPRREDAARLNMGMNEIGEIIESLNAGKYLGEFNDQGEPIDFVLVQKKDDNKLGLEDYRSLPVWTDEGMMTHLGHLVDIKIDSGPARIDHIGTERAIKLRVQVRKDIAMQLVINRVEKEALVGARKNLGEEYGLRIGGSADELASTEKSLMNSFAYALGFIYLLLVSGSFLGITWNNWFQRGNILEILKEWDVQNAQAMAADWNWITFDILTQLGIVILAGIVVNNAILIVHQMLNNIKAGMGEREALLLSCQTRLRPIMMTVISSVFGMIPLAFGEGAGTELYRGMGTALIGGLSISTLFTLFLVPVLISLLNDMGFHTKKEDLVKEPLAHH